MNINELQSRIDGFSPSDVYEGRLLCGKKTDYSTYPVGEIQDAMDSYIIALVLDGTCHVRYNDKEMVLQKGDLLVYPPGFPLLCTAISPTYQTYVLVVDSDYISETPVGEEMLEVAYIPFMSREFPRMTLTAPQAEAMLCLFDLIHQYLRQEHPYKEEALLSLLSLFVLELRGIEEHGEGKPYKATYTDYVFFNFMHLLRENYRAEHNLPFYASQLGITTTYLSRIVKGKTGATVIDIINYALYADACRLLFTTSESIVQIADKLHFADAPSFCKFFKRQRGLSPTQYRLHRAKSGR